MLPADRDSAFLWDMLTAARTTVRFVSDRTLRDYESDDMLRSAVERQIEIIGEAARKVSIRYRDLHPLIPWTGIMAQRHVLAHDYGEIKHDKIWKVATVHVPELICLLEPLIPPPPA